jgi:hypothetical protein
LQHTSLTAPSLCTHGYLRQYFLNGTLPQAGTVCAVDAELFPASSSSKAGAPKTLVQAGDRKLLEAVRTIGDVARPFYSRHLRK